MKNGEEVKMKVALVAFNGEPMCFVHVLLNAMDMKAKGYDVQVIVEGSATKLVKDLQENPSQPFAPLYEKVVAAGLIACVCMACATKMGSKESAVEQGLELCGEMNGHPSLARYIEDGYKIITF